MNAPRLVVAALALVLTGASPALAHGLGARGDLPLPKDFFVFAATLAVVLSFLAAAVMWQKARAGAVAQGRSIGAHGLIGLRTALSPLVRTVALAVFGVVTLAAWVGAPDSARNIAPVTVYVIFWVGVLWASVLFGDVWRMLNPWDTLAMYGSGRIGTAPAPPRDGSLVYSHWPAAAGLFAFQWLELAHPDPAEPRVLAVAITAYTVAILVAAARWGRGWIQTGEGFTVLFGLAAAMSPIGRDSAGRLTVRRPFVGLAAVAPRRGLAAVVLTVIGGTTFDGVSRSRWYVDLVAETDGWARAAINSVGLVLSIVAVALAYVLATLAVGRIARVPWRRAAARFAPSLMPIAIAYSVAHYFSLFVFEGQGAWRLLSDPFGKDWDLFGTATTRIDYAAVGTTTIAVVQTAAIVVGHVAAVLLAHDRAIEDFGQRQATASQVPMLVVMVALTVTGLTLLLSA